MSHRKMVGGAELFIAPPNKSRLCRAVFLEKYVEKVNAEFRKEEMVVGLTEPLKIRVVMAGSCCGKTCLVQRIKTGKYEEHDFTVGASCYSQPFHTRSEHFLLEVWDT